MQRRLGRRTAPACCGVLVAAGLCATILLSAGRGSEAAASSTSQVESAASPAAAASTVSSETARAALTRTGLFDYTAVHVIDAFFDREDYETMIETYRTSGKKDWFEATVVIDRVAYERAGVRLKGNSSLRGLANGRGSGTGGGVSADEPQGLPWLIDLDRYVDGQTHDGVAEMVVRSNNSEAAMNEAVSLDLLEMAGLPSQSAAYVRFRVNGSDEILRLVVEHPDDNWVTARFGGGALYKAESGADYSYLGTDPASYDDVFDQEAGEDNADLAPLIEFLAFINNADDVTFKAELPGILDVESFAAYLAVEELVANPDDIDGPGSNSYLHYDPETGLFTVVSWDHNLSFGGASSLVTDRMRTRSNVLVERFRANAEWEQLREQYLEEFRADLYAGGVALAILGRWTTLLTLQASDLVSPSTVESEAAQIAAYFSRGS